MRGALRRATFPAGSSCWLQKMCGFRDFGGDGFRRQRLSVGEGVAAAIQLGVPVHEIVREPFAQVKDFDSTDALPPAWRKHAQGVVEGLGGFLDGRSDQALEICLGQRLPLGFADCLQLEATFGFIFRKAEAMVYATMPSSQRMLWIEPVKGSPSRMRYFMWAPFARGVQRVRRCSRLRIAKGES